ncbi:MAG: methyl-accepting chemotaxis protein [Thermodesulfobacteriaceae bacterium]|jgi:methyl-accepting chemotaxis protein
MEVKKSIVKRIQRYFLISFALFLVISLISFYISTRFVFEKQTNNLIKNFEDTLSDFLKQREAELLSYSLTLANNKHIQNIYLSLAKEAGTLTNVNESNRPIFEKYGRILRFEYEDLVRGTNLAQYSVHFHLPQARSFVITWLKPGMDIKLDDLSGFRKTIVTAQSSRKPVTGFEAGLFEITYRTVVPILSKDGELLGSVEIAYPVDRMMEDFSQAFKQADRYVIVFNKELEKILDKKFIEEGKVKVLPQGIIYGRPKNIDEKTLDKILNAKDESLNIGTQYFFKYQLKDYAGNPMGYIAIGTDQKAVVNLFRLSALISTGLLVTLLLIIAFTITRQLKGCSQNLLTTVKMVDELAKGGGDLTFRFTSQDESEIGLLSAKFNNFLESLANIVKRLIESTKSLFGISDELYKDVSRSTEVISEFRDKAEYISMSSAEILSAMNDVSTSLEELTKAIREISEKAQVSSQMVKETSQAVFETKELAEKLKEASFEIEDVVNLINNIAEQTNLLALNASIEAARAGEAGKGFAVVANEVKELARQTQSATQEIKQKIDFLVQAAGNVSNSVEGIVSLIKNVEDAATTIASAVEEQTIVVNSVFEHISSVRDKVMITDEQAQAIKREAEALKELSERLKRQAEDIKEVANQIKELTDQFKV